MKKTTIRKLSYLSAIVAVSLAGLSGCGGDETVSAEINETKELRGYFGHNIANLRYQVVSPEGKIVQDRTTTKGEFGYNEGDSVQFYLGDVLLGEAEGQRYISVSNFDSAISILGNELPDGKAISCSEPEVEEEEVDTGDTGGDTGGDAGGDAGGDTGGDAGGDTGGDTIGGTGEADEAEASAEFIVPPIESGIIGEDAWCEDNFPEEKFTTRTKLIYSALNQSNAEVDKEILTGMYVDKDEELTATNKYFAAGTEPDDDFSYDVTSSGSTKSVTYDYLDLLGQQTFAPKAGTYIGLVTPDVVEDSTTGQQCFAGKLSVKLEYVPLDLGKKSADITGVMKVNSVYAYNENDKKVIVNGYSEQYSRNIYPAYEFSANSDLFITASEIQFKLNKVGNLEGRVHEGETDCSGSFELVR